MRVLLTGASGNFGKEYIRQSSHEVIALNRDGWGRVDELSSEIDVVIHAASDLHTSVADAPTLSLDSNVMSTAKLLEAVREAGIKRFVFLSSCAVYGESMRTQESSHCQPTSINGISKFLNERVIEAFCNENGIEFGILRVFNMYGGDDNFSILSHMRRALETGEPFTLNNNGIAQRDFVHVSDVVAIVQLLIEQRVSYTYLNIGTGISTRVSSLVNIVAERFPDFPVKQAQLEEAEYSRADISKLLGLIKYEFISIEDYLRNDFMMS